ncbi:hypothetical protein [Microvirga sp. VF16]|uniref:hypothetical protein n=1 Tax=Microvirga sp. VF16 TaxID=2807101 RepID=UPI00193E6646|nr:hypothetical protein [Microvirga sp. VF16]QRM32457.1 hypothetical protein JO965_30645 [Microvirga sp. VF16]
MARDADRSLREAMLVAPRQEGFGGRRPGDQAGAQVLDESISVGSCRQDGRGPFAAAGSCRPFATIRERPGASGKAMPCAGAGSVRDAI